MQRDITIGIFLLVLSLFPLYIMISLLHGFWNNIIYLFSAGMANRLSFMAYKSFVPDEKDDDTDDDIDHNNYAR